jgi:hypothetical protein
MNHEVSALRFGVFVWAFFPSISLRIVLIKIIKININGIDRVAKKKNVTFMINSINSFIFYSHLILIREKAKTNRSEVERTETHVGL